MPFEISDTLNEESIVATTTMIVATTTMIVATTTMIADRVSIPRGPTGMKIVLANATRNTMTIATIIANILAAIAGIVRTIAIAGIVRTIAIFIHSIASDDITVGTIVMSLVARRMAQHPAAVGTAIETHMRLALMSSVHLHRR